MSSLFPININTRIIGELLYTSGDVPVTVEVSRIGDAPVKYSGIRSVEYFTRSKRLGLHTTAGKHFYLDVKGRDFVVYAPRPTV